MYFDKIHTFMFELCPSTEGSSPIVAIGSEISYDRNIERLAHKINEAYSLLSEVLRTASQRDAQTCHILMESFLNRGLAVQSYNVACQMFQRNLIPDINLWRKVDNQLTLERQPAAGKLIVKFLERGLLNLKQEK